MTRSALWLVFTLFACASCATNDDAATAGMATGEFTYSFSDWNGPAIDVRLVVPEGTTADTPILFVIHGWSRDVERYYNDWSGLAEKHGFVAVVPHYPVEDFPTANEFNQGHVFDAASGEQRPADTWTFASIEAVFDDVTARIGSTESDYTIYGHSAGSQFVHRYLWHVPDARVKRYLAANAGWYTQPVYDVAYPYGFSGADIPERQLADALGKDVVILLGKEDTQTNSPNLRNTPEAKAQGPNRYMRGLQMMRKAEDAAEALDTEFNWQVVVVEEAGHVNAEMAVIAAELVE